MFRPTPRSTLFPYTTLFRSSGVSTNIVITASETGVSYQLRNNVGNALIGSPVVGTGGNILLPTGNLTTNTTFNILATIGSRSEEHTSELQSQSNLVCRLLLE